MAAFSELREAQEIEISLQHTLGGFEAQHLTRQVDDAGWNTDFSLENWVVVEAAIEPNACADSVGYEGDRFCRSSSSDPIVPKIIEPAVRREYRAINLLFAVDMFVAYSAIQTRRQQ